MNETLAQIFPENLLTLLKTPLSCSVQHDRINVAIICREKKKTRPSAKSNSLKSTLSEMCYFKRFCLELKKQQEAISKNSKKSHMFYITVFLEEFFVRKVALLRTIILNQIFQNKICTNSRPIFPSYRNQ